MEHLAARLKEVGSVGCHSCKQGRGRTLLVCYAPRHPTWITVPPLIPQVVAAHGERVLETPTNRISFGITLDTFGPGPSGGGAAETPSKDMDQTYLGSMLFTRCVSGTRVVRRGEVKKVCGLEFQGFGSSLDDYPHTYMTAAAAIGGSREEIDRFIDVLGKTLISFKEKRKKEAKKQQPKAPETKQTALGDAGSASGGAALAAEPGAGAEEA